MVITNGLSFVHDEQEFTGVVKIAQKVCQDVRMVFGPTFDADIRKRNTPQKRSGHAPNILFGTLGQNEELHALEKSKAINLEPIRNKRECYGFFVLENTLVIAGSDKRGTIYGLFYFSKLLGVSPLVNWAQMIPEKKSSFTLTSRDTYISKEPSIKYRGFFINDEWPAFGNWANHNFGGFNVTMYEQVFELLLRLKGNYLWPAMWASRFSDEGPGLANAELADELGIIMGASHHEPCCRAGEEYKYLRGPDSIYGDSWNFWNNREGIIRFWEDGLKRNGKFENVITMGMRGEADTPILEKKATLQDNVDLLREVISTQNSLIKDQVNHDIQEVPRMLALYKEVEPYFYGDEHTQGLMNDPELEGVTLMLCDDNHGNLRTLPTESMRSHTGGYGMYYHFDYHGSPYSYEWLNTTYLPKVKEQMTMAYDFGIRELWVVNVGDIMTNEFPLSYFLDLAYDFETYSNQKETTENYTKSWVSQQFPSLSGKQQQQISEILSGYTKLTHIRRTECLMPDTYHPQNFSEADRALERAEKIIAMAEQLKQDLPSEIYPLFFSQVYFPACGTMNVLRMQLLSGKNHWFAHRGVAAANWYAQKVRDCYVYDRNLVTECDTLAGGRWYAMGWSEHFGFTHWCEGENQYPIYMHAEPTRKNRLVAWVQGTDITTTGQEWTRKNLRVTAFRNPETTEETVYLAECSEKFTQFHLSFLNNPRGETTWLRYDIQTNKEQRIHTLVLRIDREKLSVHQQKTEYLEISYQDGRGGLNSIIIEIDARVPDLDYPINTYIQTEDYISIEAEHYTNSFETKEGRFNILPGYGKTLSAIKAFPTTQYFNDLSFSPKVEYYFVPLLSGTHNISFYLNPSNPVTQDNQLQFSYSLSGQTFQTQPTLVDVLGPSFAVGDDQEPWSTDITQNIRIITIQEECKPGLNILRVQPITPGFVLEKLVISHHQTTVPDSYLGPPESYRR